MILVNSDNINFSQQRMTSSRFVILQFIRTNIKIKIRTTGNFVTFIIFQAPAFRDFELFYSFSNGFTDYITAFLMLSEYRKTVDKYNDTKF